MTNISSLVVDDTDTCLIKCNEMTNSMNDSMCSVGEELSSDTKH